MLMRTQIVHAPRYPLPNGVTDTVPILSRPQEPIHAMDLKLALTRVDPQILVYPRHAFSPRLPDLTEFVRNSGSCVPLSKHPAWLNILATALGHEPYAIEATAAGKTVGFLPLAYLDTLLFGKFLVSLPYLSTNGVVAACPSVREALVARAVSLADELNVRHLELRQETAISHAGLQCPNRFQSSHEVIATRNSGAIVEELQSESPESNS